MLSIRYPRRPFRSFLTPVFLLLVMWKIVQNRFKKTTWDKTTQTHRTAAQRHTRHWKDMRKRCKSLRKKFPKEKKKEVNAIQAKRYQRNEKKKWKKLQHMKNTKLSENLSLIVSLDSCTFASFFLLSIPRNQRKVCPQRH